MAGLRDARAGDGVCPFHGPPPPDGGGIRSRRIRNARRRPPPYPWGDETPTVEHANLDLRRFDPESVGIRPRGASAWGVQDLAGNGWEWTSTPFAPFDGFVPMASYPQYSADFFDGEHFVCKGASPVTPPALLRRSFRNWYRSEYPYMYATFRASVAS